MGEEGWPKIRLDTGLSPAHGLNTYKPLPETVEYRRRDVPLLQARSLALGRVVFTLEKESGELLGIHSYVKTSRWRTEDMGELPYADAQGALFLEYPENNELVFIKCEPEFWYHEIHRALRIIFLKETRLVFRVADCLLVGADDRGCLTEVWMLELPLAVERRL